MPALLNPRYEIFAQYVAKGQTLADAYVLAGYKASRKNASTLGRKSEIRQRIDQIRERSFNIDAASTARAIERLAITKEALAREFVPLATSSMKNYVTVSPLEGQPYFDFSAVTEDQWRAVKAMTIEEFVDGKGGNAREVRRVKFQLHDKVPAGMAIAKLFGWIVERREDVNKLEERLRAMTPEQRAADAEELHRKVRQMLLEDQRAREAEAEAEGGVGYVTEEPEAEGGK